MFIAIAPKLLAATRTALMLWRLATGGDVVFQEVKSCSDVHGAPCVSVDPTPTLKKDRVGETWKYGDQYIILVLDANAEVITHEIGHVLLGMRYHAAPDTSIMSPVMGPKCLTLEDAERYALVANRKLILWCLP